MWKGIEEKAGASIHHMSFPSGQRHLFSWKYTVSPGFHWTTSDSSVFTLFQLKYVT